MAADPLHETMVVTIGMRMVTETMDTNLGAMVSMVDEAMGDGTVSLMGMAKHTRTTAMARLRPKTRVVFASFKFCSLVENLRF